MINVTPNKIGRANRRCASPLNVGQRFGHEHEFHHQSDESDGLLSYAAPVGSTMKQIYIAPDQYN
jgi:hypothetical protein